MRYARDIQPKLTPARHRWLARLATDGPSKRPPRSRVGYDCMKLGWTEWDMRLDGVPITKEEIREKFPEGIGRRLDPMDYRERLTAAGQAMLESAGDPPPARKRKTRPQIADTPENRLILAEDLRELKLMHFGHSEPAETLAEKDVRTLQMLIRSRERMGKPYYPLT